MHNPAPSYRLMLRQRPTWLTQETVLGATLPLMLSPLLAASVLPFCAFGMAVGAFTGNRRIEKENDEGRIVPPPTYFNKQLLAGLAVGVAAASGIGLLAGAGMLAAAALFSFGISAPSLAISVAAAYALGSIASVAMGGYLGARYGKRRMEAEYEFASLSGTPIHPDGPARTASAQPAQADEKQQAHSQEATHRQEAASNRFVTAENTRREQAAHIASNHLR